MKLTLISIAFTFASSSFSVSAFDLSGTEFASAAKRYNLDPILLYSVALAESASGRGNEKISPWPWTLRTIKEPFYALNQNQAVTRLTQLLKEKGSKTSVDIGLMQINLFWHGHRVKTPVDLLDPVINLDTGAQILSETIASASGDLELGIGRYHNWKDHVRSRAYGRRVLSIYNQIKTLQENRYATNYDN
ncbi:lytic transglycosylase domain-containing protein [Pseudoalteromonas sp. TAB23]|uniref:lytic transglycosylase domain-containing protein n=1 Tax=Pseudoalteromonas sp. TAB23 TaxID=1938595 RepID=UPI0003F9744E|nr:lytic transglycosylase domain-containing protein [Pseudoalteromonas sp. TAB23]